MSSPSGAQDETELGAATQPSSHSTQQPSSHSTQRPSSHSTQPTQTHAIADNGEAIPVLSITQNEDANDSPVTPNHTTASTTQHSSLPEAPQHSNTQDSRSEAGDCTQVTSETIFATTKSIIDNLTLFKSAREQTRAAVAVAEQGYAKARRVLDIAQSEQERVLSDRRTLISKGSYVESDLAAMQFRVRSLEASIASDLENLSKAHFAVIESRALLELIEGGLEGIAARIGELLNDHPSTKVDEEDEPQSDSKTADDGASYHGDEDADYKNDDEEASQFNPKSKKKKRSSIDSEQLCLFHAVTRGEFIQFATKHAAEIASILSSQRRRSDPITNCPKSISHWLVPDAMKEEVPVEVKGRQVAFSQSFQLEPCGVPLTNGFLNTKNMRMAFRDPRDAGEALARVAELFIEKWPLDKSISGRQRKDQARQKLSILSAPKDSNDETPKSKRTKRSIKVDDLLESNASNELGDAKTQDHRLRSSLFKKKPNPFVKVSDRDISEFVRGWQDRIVSLIQNQPRRPSKDVMACENDSTKQWMVPYDTVAMIPAGVVGCMVTGPQMFKIRIKYHALEPESLGLPKGDVSLYFQDPRDCGDAVMRLHELYEEFASTRPRSSSRSKGPMTSTTNNNVEDAEYKPGEDQDDEVKTDDVSEGEVDVPRAKSQGKPRARKHKYTKKLASDKSLRKRQRTPSTSSSSFS